MKKNKILDYQEIEDYNPVEHYTEDEAEIYTTGYENGEHDGFIDGVIFFSKILIVIAIWYIIISELLKYIGS